MAVWGAAPILSDSNAFDGRRLSNACKCSEVEVQYYDMGMAPAQLNHTAPKGCTISPNIPNK